MPLNAKGEEILNAMRDQYGSRAEEVFYASKNAGTISGVDQQSILTFLEPFKGFLRGLLTWATEEEGEEEHATDAWEESKVKRAKGGQFAKQEGRGGGEAEGEKPEETASEPASGGGGGRSTAGRAAPEPAKPVASQLMPEPPTYSEQEAKELGHRIAASVGAAEMAADAQRKLDAAFATGIDTKTQYTDPTTGQYTPERQRVHQAILSAIFTPEAIARAKPPAGQSPTMTVLGGRGGSGKSWLSDASKGGPVDQSKAILIDSDHFKTKLPDYQGWNAALLHNECDDLVEAAERLAQQLGVNVIHDATIKSAGGVGKRVKEYQEAGFDIEGHYMFCPPEEATRRAMKRFATVHQATGKGRFVPGWVILGNTDNERHFDNLIRHFKRWSVHDNSVLGQTPRLVARSGDGDSLLPLKPLLSGSANDILAIDRDTVRNKDVDGRLHVAESNISKATVNPYKGDEIPGWEQLGLDPGRVYWLLRHPAELAKAAPTFNNLPILAEHVPVSADSDDAHHPELVIGSTGTDATYADPYLRNSLVFWAGPAIEDIENGDQKELSAGYHYEPDMTPGVFEGQRYDGVMRNIIGNHLALVRRGRAGPDVVVGDSAMEEDDDMAMRKAVVAQIKGILEPKIGQDNGLEAILPLLAALENGTDQNPATQTGGEPAPLGELPAGMVARELGSRDNMSTAPNAGLPAGLDQEEVKKIVKETRAADARRRLGRDETDEEREKREGEDAAADTAAADQRVGLMPHLDNGGGDEAQNPQPDLVTKSAMDAAISAAVRAALDGANQTQRDIREAEKAVRPYVGELAIAHDSAEAVYRTALGALGVKVDGVHASALPTILAMLPNPNTPRPEPARGTVAMDAAAEQSYAERFPGAEKIRRI